VESFWLLGLGPIRPCGLFAVEPGTDVLISPIYLATFISDKIPSTVTIAFSISSMVFVKVRGESDTGFRTKVHENVAPQEFLTDFLRIGQVDGDSAAATLRVARGIDLPASLIGQFDQARGHSGRFGANAVHTPPRG